MTLNDNNTTTFKNKINSLKRNFWKKKLKKKILKKKFKNKKHCLKKKFFFSNTSYLILLDICICSLSNGTFPDALIIAMVI